MSASYPDLNLTNFPENIDTFMQWLNITATDGPLIAQYQSAMEAGNTTLANQILSQIPSGTQKIIKATDLNQLTQALLAVERFYLTDIQPYIENQQENWLSVINQFDYKGVWSNGTSYEVNNLVTYTVSGLTLVYIATSTPPVGTVPTNTVYWRLLTIQGQQGISGQGLSYHQEWNISANYQVNDSVTYNNALWMAIQPSVAQTPGDGSAYWQKVMNLEVTTYPIQDTQPENQTVNSLWLNTSDSPTDYYYLEPLTNPIEANMIPIGYQTYDAQGQVLDGQGPLPIASGGTDAVDSQNAIVNLGAGVRENKLRNPYFYGGGQNDNLPINQNSGTLDGWTSLSGGNVVINSNSITFSNTTGQGDVYYFQKVDLKDLRLGEQYTASVLFLSGSSTKYVEFICFVPDGIGYQNFSGNYVLDAGLSTVSFIIPENTTSAEFRIYIGQNGTIGSFEAFASKLEEENNQTLSYNDSNGVWQYIPQNNSKPSQVLAECQKYQLALWRYFITPAIHFQPNYIDFSIPIPVEMRTTPVLNQEDFSIFSDIKGGQSGFTLSVVGISSNAIRIRATKEAHGLTIVDSVRLEVNVERTILNADL